MHEIAYLFFNKLWTTWAETKTKSDKNTYKQ